MDILLGIENISNFHTNIELEVLISKDIRQKYSSILQDINVLDLLLLTQDIIDDHTINSQEDVGLFDSITNSTSITLPSSPSSITTTTTTIPSSLSSNLTIFPSLFDTTDDVSNTNSINMNLSERYQHALLTLRNNAQAKNLSIVYHRILKKIKKLEHQLEDITKNIEGENKEIQVALDNLTSFTNNQTHFEESTSLNNPINIPIFEHIPKIIIHPHHLKWEAIDISIPAGGKVSLPIPVPILPASAQNTSEVK